MKTKYVIVEVFYGGLRPVTKGGGYLNDNKPLFFDEEWEATGWMTTLPANRYYYIQRVTPGQKAV